MAPSIDTATDLEKASEFGDAPSPVQGGPSTRFVPTLTLREELDAKRQNTIKLPLERRLTIERTHSIGGTSITRPRIDPSARLAGEFRTLSIHARLLELAPRSSRRSTTPRMARRSRRP